VEHKGPDGPLTGGRVAVRRSGNGERWWWPKARGGEGIVDSTRGEKGGSGCGGVRRGRGALL
jgi:hypothetical protein